MLISIHQPHFFPWYGYINKIASSDVFVLLDECQFSKGSKMNRQTLLCNNGDLKYITLPVVKKGLLDTPFSKIEISSNEWKKNCKEFIINNYKNYPHFEDIWREIEYIFLIEDNHVFNIVNETIICLLRILEIDTKIIYQSDLCISRELKNNDLLVEICKKCGCNHYVSGNGAKKYMDLDKFKMNDIIVSYQSFIYPEYEKFLHHNEKNISILDMLFNIGIEETKEYIMKDAYNSKMAYLHEEANHVI